MTKIIHVHLVGKRKDFYFGSISAVYEKFNSADIGVSMAYLQHAGLSQGTAIVNDKAIIKQGTLIRGSRNV